MSDALERAKSFRAGRKQWLECYLMIGDLMDEIERLRADLAKIHLANDRVIACLANALAHTPESYSEPIFTILRKKRATEAAGGKHDST